MLSKWYTIKWWPKLKNPSSRASISRSITKTLRTHQITFWSIPSKYRQIYSYILFMLLQWNNGRNSMKITRTPAQFATKFSVCVPHTKNRERTYTRRKKKVPQIFIDRNQVAVWSFVNMVKPGHPQNWMKTNNILLRKAAAVSQHWQQQQQQPQSKMNTPYKKIYMYEDKKKNTSNNNAKMNPVT